MVYQTGINHVSVGHGCIMIELMQVGSDCVDTLYQRMYQQCINKPALSAGADTVSAGTCMLRRINVL